MSDPIEFEIVECINCRFCHSITMVDDVIYFCGLKGGVLKAYDCRPIRPDWCEIAKVIFEMEGE